MIVLVSLPWKGPYLLKGTETVGSVVAVRGVVFGSTTPGISPNAKCLDFCSFHFWFRGLR